MIAVRTLDRLSKAEALAQLTDRPVLVGNVSVAAWQVNLPSPCGDTRVIQVGTTSNGESLKELRR
jgi:hypothetical protein